MSFVASFVTVFAVGTVGVVVLALLVGLGPGRWRERLAAGSGSPVLPSPTATAPPSLAFGSATGLQTPVPAPRPAGAVGVPVSVTIARLKITSPLQALGLEPDGSLQSPSRYADAGWYAKGVRPGEVGPAVIAGHIDSVNGPAVFYRLPMARVGDDVTIVDSLGITRHFIVSDIKEYPKQRFPSQAVYGPTALATVRLVTCYGAFDQAKKSYVDNVVVSAILKA